MTDSFNQPGILTIAVSNVSGQTVYIRDSSGDRIEAFPLSGAQYLRVSVSGQPVTTTLSLSGVSIASNVSGNVVYLTSGQNYVQNSGQVIYPVSGIAHLKAFDPSGQTWNDVWVQQSGGHDVRIFGSLSANVSGNVVYLVDDSVNNVVKMSGQVVNISGQTVVASVTTNISGQVVYFASGQNFVQNSGQTVIVPSTSISGNIVNTSGQVAIISGQPLLVSGQLVAVSGLVATSVSGNMVSISGQPVNVSGNLVNTSGNVNFDFGTLLRTTSGTIITSLSGGTELGSGIVINATVRNLSGNAPMYIGGTGGNSPFSGFGMILFGNESQTFDIDNFNRIRLFANTSGQRVRVIGVAAN